eukprot:2182016-Prymnesium_polylepis.1
MTAKLWCSEVHEALSKVETVRRADDDGIGGVDARLCEQAEVLDTAARTRAVQDGVIPPAASAGDVDHLRPTQRFCDSPCGKILARVAADSLRAPADPGHRVTLADERSVPAEEFHPCSHSG